MKNSDDFVGLLLQQKGDRYRFGVENKISDPDPPSFDCSELVEWGCGRLKIDPRMPDGSWLQIQHCRRHDTLLKVSQAIDTQGALLFRFGGNPFGNSRPASAHVAVSLGNGSTIEARGKKFGVNCFKATGRNWTHAARIPGLDYRKAAKKIAGTPDAWHRYITQPPEMAGDDVRAWQLKMRERGWRIRTDGVYDKDSEHICVQFQREKSLEVDGVIGPQTWHATWHAPVTP